MNCEDENQNLNKNTFVIAVMLYYLEDFEFLYEAFDLDNSNFIYDIEDVITDLVDFQGDICYYTPLGIT
tara:strand:+ start:904 stop:1110 length:207 start_codon:yes stop_codon:yes gene_type:complete